MLWLAQLKVTRETVWKRPSDFSYAHDNSQLAENSQLATALGCPALLAIRVKNRASSEYHLGIASFRKYLQQGRYQGSFSSYEISWSVQAVTAVRKKCVSSLTYFMLGKAAQPHLHIPNLRAWHLRSQNDTKNDTAMPTAVDNFLLFILEHSEHFRAIHEWRF